MLTLLEEMVCNKDKDICEHKIRSNDYFAVDTNIIPHKIKDARKDKNTLGYFKANYIINNDLKPNKKSRTPYLKEKYEGDKEDNKGNEFVKEYEKEKNPNYQIFKVGIIRDKWFEGIDSVKATDSVKDLVKK